MIRLDCIYYLGEKPCKFGRMCEGCEDYRSMGVRILVLKHAAMGDVLRTTPILHGLKRKYPHSHITWVTDPAVADLLRYNSFINTLLVYDASALARLAVEEFDVLISLDKEPRVAALAMTTIAHEKLGIGLSPFGTVYPLNPEEEYYFSLGLSDELKFFQNRKAYQELIFDALKLDYHKDDYVLEVPERFLEWGRKKLESFGVTKQDMVIGLNTGAGGVFAHKDWTTEGYVALIERFAKERHVKVLLLGGKAEKEKNQEILSRSKGKAIDTGSDNSLLEFCGIVNGCDVVVTGDTLGMHIAIALKKQVLAIFGSTCSQEIELYGRGEKITPKVDCAPCYKKHCEKEVNCMNTITVDEVYDAVKRLEKWVHK
ncbi:MAG: glycosyltransferase family 9 protein [Deltaproteobacteria bacterium]|nr:glycosyltransferase family 9 protein [Deltaproteobacteria bacterium]